MSWSEVSDPTAVLRAVEEFKEVEARAFYRRYGFGPPKTQALVIDGREYPSKAILGVAHGYQFPTAGPLRSADFTGGEHTVKRVLEKMGFEVRAPSGERSYGASVAERLLPGTGSGSPNDSDEVLNAVQDAVRGYRRGRRVITAAEVKAIEHRAVEVATAHYAADGWSVKDVGATHSYDLLCTRDSEELHVEVKGTTGTGARVGLTRNEVDHARGFAAVSLVIVADIALDRSDQLEPKASGGRLTRYDPWSIDEGTLVPLTFEYSPPQLD